MNVVAVAEDPGGARVVLPVLRALASSATATLSCEPHGHAEAIWRAAGLASIRAEVPTHVLAATSVSPQMHELRRIRAARTRGIRTVSVLDHWINYRQRFVLEGELVLPDVIAVMDEQARNAMLSLGFPSDVVVVTGSPALEELAHGLDLTPSDARARLRAMAPGADGQLVVWVSQPLASGLSERELGFGSASTFTRFATVLERVARRNGRAVDLFFKPHPREGDGPPPRTERSEFLRVHPLGSGYPPRAAALGADLVAGMHSMLLVEACLLGRPVVSFQPGLAVPDPLPSNAAGWSHAAFDEPTLERVLPHALAGESPRGGSSPDPVLHRGAVERILDLLRT